VSAMPLSQLLSLPHPLVDPGGQSQVSSLCDETASRLEQLRREIDPVLAAVGIGREQVSAAWSFRTQDLLSRLQALYAAPYLEDLPLKVTELDNRTPLQRGLALLQVSRVITGKLTTLDYLDPVTRAFRPTGVGVRREIGFVLTLPRGLSQGEAAPVVVFGHGMSTEKRLGLFLADKLAGAGYAMMAIDLPLHGDRTVCLSDGDCAGGAQCAADGVCLQNGQPADVRRLPAPSGWGSGIPVASGQAFVDVENLFATRDHFRQAIVDVAAQVRLIRLMDWREATGGFHLDPERVHYAGISLGAILGTAVGAGDPAFEAMLLNVGGAGLTDLIQESFTFSSTLRAALADKGIEEGSPEHFAFVNASRWVFDEIDPINLGRYLAKAPRTYPDPRSGETRQAPAKRLRLHMAWADTVVPNSATYRLADATGIDRDTQFRAFVGTHGFLANPAEIACYVGQDDLVDFLEGRR
jgi:pimeloyl-ACP methyl ester carboxylesterase